MSRLTELEERSIIGMLARIKAQHADMKITPQPTSVVSGIRTYQVPEHNLWDTFELVRNGVSSNVNQVLLPGTGGVYNMKFLQIITSFTPDNQESPVVYPFLQLMLGDQQWEPRYHPSFGLTFSTKPNQSYSLVSTDYLRETTDYSSQKLIYKYDTSLNYGIAASGGAPLKVRFRLRSTDRGKTTVKVVLND